LCSRNSPYTLNCHAVAMLVFLCRITRCVGGPLFTSLDVEEEWTNTPCGWRYLFDAGIFVFNLLWRIVSHSVLLSGVYSNLISPSVVAISYRTELARHSTDLHFTLCRVLHCLKVNRVPKICTFVQKMQRTKPWTIVHKRLKGEQQLLLWTKQ